MIYFGGVVVVVVVAVVVVLGAEPARGRLRGRLLLRRTAEAPHKVARVGCVGDKVSVEWLGIGIISAKCSSFDVAGAQWEWGTLIAKRPVPPDATIYFDLTI